MSHKGTRKIENDKENMILQNLRVYVGSVEEKEKRERGGEEPRNFFRNGYYLTVTLLLPLEVKGMNKMPVKEKKISDRSHGFICHGTFHLYLEVLK